MAGTQRLRGGRATLAVAFAIAFTLGVLGGPAVYAQTTTLAPPTTIAPPTTAAPPPTTAAPPTTQAPPPTTSPPPTTRPAVTTVPPVTTTLSTTTVAPVADDVASESTAVVLVALAVVAAALLIAVVVARLRHDKQNEVAEAAGWRVEAVRSHGDATVLRDLLGGTVESDDSWWVAVQARADTVDRQLATLEANAPDPEAAGAAGDVRRSLRSLLYAVESKRLLYRRGGTPSAAELETADGTLRVRARDVDAALVQLEQQATGAPGS